MKSVRVMLSRAVKTMIGNYEQDQAVRLGRSSVPFKFNTALGEERGRKKCTDSMSRLGARMIDDGSWGNFQPGNGDMGVTQRLHLTPLEFVAA